MHHNISIKSENFWITNYIWPYGFQVRDFTLWAATGISLWFGEQGTFPGVVGDRMKEEGVIRAPWIHLSSPQGLHRELHMSYGLWDLPVPCSMYSFPRATVTSYCMLGGLNRNFLSRCSGARGLKSWFWQSWSLLRAVLGSLFHISVLGFGWLSSPLSSTLSFLCA